MSIADQVDTLEHDHAAALAQIDALNAANAALASANASLQRDNVGLQLEVNDMKHYVDDTRAMAEQIAQSAYDMLRASRRQVGGQAEVIPFAPNPERQVGKRPALAAEYGRRTLAEALQDSVALLKGDISGSAQREGIIAEAERLLQNNEPEPPAQQAVAEIMAGDCYCDLAANPQECKEAGQCVMARDSGDEQPEKPKFLDPIAADIAKFYQQERLKYNAANSAKIDAAPVGFTHCSECPDPPSCRGVCQVNDALTREADAHIAEHGEGSPPRNDLPEFLKRDTAFAVMVRPDQHVFG